LSRGVSSLSYYSSFCLLVRSCCVSHCFSFRYLLSLICTVPLS
jgi:hypothetical protein